MKIIRERPILSTVLAIPTVVAIVTGTLFLTGIDLRFWMTAVDLKEHVKVAEAKFNTAKEERWELYRRTYNTAKEERWELYRRTYDQEEASIQRQLYQNQREQRLYRKENMPIPEPLLREHRRLQLDILKARQNRKRYAPK
jgi:hypothetical protein